MDAIERCIQKLDGSRVDHSWISKVLMPDTSSLKSYPSPTP
jgi:hypothetical protein